MKFPPAVSTCLLMVTSMSVCALLATSSLAAEKDKTREQDKHKPKPVEESSLQTLTTVYVNCVSGAIATTLSEEKGQLSTGDIESVCKDERKNLKLKASNQFIRTIDEKFLSAYNAKGQPG